jgi:hypothetical protein
MKTKRKKPISINILILTVFTAIIWTCFEVYRALTLRPDPNIPPEILAPLTPALDANSLDKLQSRLYLDENQIPDTVISSSGEVSQIEEASPSPEPVEESTEEGEINEEV